MYLLSKVTIPPILLFSNFYEQQENTMPCAKYFFGRKVVHSLACVQSDTPTSLGVGVSDV